MAMMCRVRLICRFPARESRCRTWSPEEASIGAVPFQDAKWPRSGNRVMSPTSTSSRAAPEGPMPCRSSSAGAGRGDQLAQLLVRGLLAGVDPFEVGDQLGGDPAPGLAGGVARSDLRQQCLGLGRGQVLLRPAGDQLQQQVVQLADHPGVVLTQRPAPVDQHPQHRELLVVDHRSQPGHPGPDQGDRVGVGGVGLAALTGREHPRPGRQLRRHVDDLLAGSKQPHRDVVADPVAALDRPHPVGRRSGRSRLT